MPEQPQTALQKMQQIANRLISNTPQLLQMLDNDSLLKPKRPFSPTSNKKNSLNNKTASTLLNYNKQQMTANDYHEKCKQLASQLLSQKDKTQQLQDQINIIKQRFVEREIQYRKIIEELQEEIKAKSFLDSNDRNKMQNIKQLHSEIISNISSIQSKTSKILIEQESDIRRFFHKKINQIKQKFKEDKINKSQKDQQYQAKEKQMISQLQWIKNIAYKIDNENQQIVKKYATLKSQLEIQSNDKEILLKELLMKKKENAVLKAQVEQYEKLLNQVSKQMDEEDIDAKSYQTGQQPSYTKLPAVNLMKKQNSTNVLQNSRTSQNKGPRDSRVSKQPRTQNIQSKQQLISNQVNIDKRSYQNTISHLKSIIQKQKKKVKQLKNLYMKEIGTKSQLQKIIRKLVDDVRESIVQVEKERRRKKNGSGVGLIVAEELGQESRQQLLEKLLTNEKILTLIYDKTFYSNHTNNKNFGTSSNHPLSKAQQVPQELQQLLQDDDTQGFM